MWWRRAAGQALLVGLVVLCAAGIAGAEKPTPEPSPKPTPDAFSFDIPVPEGEPVKGIKIPYYDEDGTTLQMVLEASLARRLDEKTIEIEQLKIDANSDDGRKLFVEMPEAEFDLETRMLKGTDGVFIHREDFEIHGRKGEFDIRKRFGRVLGNVKMVIYNLEEN